MRADLGHERLAGFDAWLGSVIALSTDSGTVTDRYSYGAYGESATLAGAAFRFTGRRLDPESGLYYYRARYYSPALGRFLQTDPIGYQGGLNLYAYVQNDPLNNTDQTGLFTLQIGIAGGGTIFGFVVPQGGFGIAIDTRGNIGTYSYAGVGIGVGVGARVGGSLQLSNAQTIYDLSGPFINTSLHGGNGVGGSVDFFTGSSPNGPVTGGGITFGASAGASASLTTTTTEVCGSQGCAGPLPSLGSTSLVTPAAAAVTLSQPQLMPNTGSGLSSQSSVSPAIATTGGRTPPK